MHIYIRSHMHVLMEADMSGWRNAPHLEKIKCAKIILIITSRCTDFDQVKLVFYFMQFSVLKLILQQWLIFLLWFLWKSNPTKRIRATTPGLTRRQHVAVTQPDRTIGSDNLFRKKVENLLKIFVPVTDFFPIVKKQIKTPTVKIWKVHDPEQSFAFRSNT